MQLSAVTSVSMSVGAMPTEGSFQHATVQRNSSEQCEWSPAIKNHYNAQQSGHSAAVEHVLSTAHCDTCQNWLSHPNDLPPQDIPTVIAGHTHCNEQ